MIHLPNTSLLLQLEDAEKKEHLQRSTCMVGIFPVIYYSILLCLGLPVNVLTAIALSRLFTKTQKSSYCYLLALTTSDILTQIFIVFVGFILQTAILHRKVPDAFIQTVSILEFGSNHASIWITVVLTVDRYVALCHPLQYRRLSYPERTKKIILLVFLAALITGIPFYWWSDVWRNPNPPNTLDKILMWVHCFIIYFIPCTVFLITNSVIIENLRKSKKCNDYQLHVGKTTAILLAITTVFAILWAPRTFTIIYHMYVSTVYKDWRVHLAMDVSNMLALLNTAVNFFLYCFVSQQFRAMVWEVLGIQKSHCTRSANGSHSGSLSDLTLKPLGLLNGTCL
ncbi:G protein-coupled receptor 142 [Microcaecilia unicolor]|uniref:Probable G-protein coupled receptor 142 n=1 Tax=Microcaecilia unicolor TaxID=1415580 RepID=A0A6P7Y5C5_9AMPH|nr:probable G-protein coupled receptor 142 [Microcaecilia unicolor]